MDRLRCWLAAWLSLPLFAAGPLHGQLTDAGKRWSDPNNDSAAPAEVNVCRAATSAALAKIVHMSCAHMRASIF